ncbi:MAG: hypothetical protein R6X20_17775 [Phycisphaerae bacterium]
MPEVRVELFDVKDYLGTSTHLLLKQPQKKQRQAVAQAISRIRSRLPDANLNIISLHACHFRGSIPFFVCAGNCVAKIEPHVCVTLIDDVYSCRERLLHGGYPFRYHQLLSWRQIECGLADTVAEVCDVDNFYLAAKHPSIMLYRLIFEPTSPRLYSASQITSARNDAQKRGEINTHRRQIHQAYTVFDPLTIDDRILVNDLPQNEDAFQIESSARWPFDISNLGNGYGSLVPEDDTVFPVEVESDEAKALARPDQMSDFQSTIDAQITHRDYRYIDQADVMAAYRPRLLGHESGGVAAEKTYAAGTGSTPVVEYSPPEDTDETGSKPFGTPLAGPVLKDLHGFYEKLKSTAREEAERRYRTNEDRYKVFEEFVSHFRS